MVDRQEAGVLRFASGMNQVLVTLIGVSWKTTLMGFAEAIFLVVIDFWATHEIGDTPESRKLFWGGLGLAVCAAIRGRVSKDSGVSNALNPVLPARNVDQLDEKKPGTVEKVGS